MNYRIITRGAYQGLLAIILLHAVHAQSGSGENLSCIMQTIDKNVASILDNICTGSGSQPDLCAPTPILGTTTITTSGSYCLATNITGQITINADYVNVDLSGRTITNNAPCIIIGAYRQIAIHHGTLTMTAGLPALQANGTSALKLAHITAANGAIGADLITVLNAGITQCDFSFNTNTGLNLTDCRETRITKCTASNNGIQGFSLAGSHHTCIIDCKALNNGSESPSDGFGFVSANGSGNIFSHCMANETQTNSQEFASVAAGFALTGTEHCSTISNCSACAASAPFSMAQTPTRIVSARPHGVYLQDQFNTDFPEIASLEIGSVETTTVVAIKWSPDQKYLAVGFFKSVSFGQTDSEIRIYQVEQTNCQTPQFTVIASQTVSLVLATSIVSLDWSPDGRYLAVGRNKKVDILTFDTTKPPAFILSTFASIQLAGANDNDVKSITWSPNGNYVAFSAAINSSTTDQDVLVYQFNPSQVANFAVIPPASVPRLTFVDSVQVAASGVGASAIDWHPSGTYLAVGGDLSGDDLLIFSFDPAAANQLTQIISINPGDIVDSLDWSASGKYLAVGRIDALIIYIFDAAPASLSRLLSEILNIGFISIPVQSIQWAANEQYITITTIEADNLSAIIVYQFNPNNKTITELESIGYDFVPNSSLLAAWSPDGQYIAAGGKIPGNDLRVYKALNFPEQNMIMGNITACNTTAAPSCPRGVGISGSSIANCIIGNTAYNQPLNYTFVTNTHTQLLQGNFAPSTLQNVSLNGCQPICTPDNVASILSISLAKSCANMASIIAINNQIP